MSIALPDKWVRKAIDTALTGLTVDSKEIPLFDSFVTSGNPSQYVLMTTQTNDEVDGNKCVSHWDSSIVLDAIAIYDRAGNYGSRLFVDNIIDEVRIRVKNLQLDVASGLTITHQRFIFPNDLSFNTDTQNIYRKIMRLELRIEKI